MVSRPQGLQDAAALLPVTDADRIKERLGDQWWRLSNLYWITDPYGNAIPFVPNDSQEELYRKMWYLNIILKDRQRGFSTFIAILMLDYILFNSDKQCGIIDISLPDAKKKLAKVTFAHERLPQWLKDEVPVKVDNKEEFVLGNGSSIYVGTSHRGGTLQMLHVSEMGKIAARRPDRAREIRTGALNTIVPGCFIFVESTAEGAGGEFYDDVQAARRLLASGARLTELDYRFHFFAWWMGHRNEIDPEGVVIPLADKKYFDDLEEELDIELGPRKRAWYVKKQAQQKDDMKREYPSTPDEAFEQAVQGAYFQSAMNLVRKESKIGKVPHEPGYPVVTAWDLGMNDQMAIWFIQRIGMQTRLIRYYEDSGEGFEFYARVLNDFPYNYARHYMPHDVTVRELGTGMSRISVAERLGVRPIMVIPRAKNSQDLLSDIEATRHFLQTCWVDEEHCAQGIKCLDNYTKEFDDKRGVFRNTPCHNWASHGASALRTGAIGISMYGIPGAFEDNITYYEPEVV